VEGGEGAEGVDECEEGEAGEDAELLRDPAEREAHEDLKNGGEYGDRGLGAAHEVARNDEHQRGLSDYSRECAEESEEHLKKYCGE